MKKISLNLNGMTKVMSEMELKHVVGGNSYGGIGANNGTNHWPECKTPCPSTCIQDNLCNCFGPNCVSWA